MAWTAPMTAVTGDIFTAAQFNTHVRDNLLETAPAKATTAGNYFVSTGTNQIAERTPVSATILTSQNNLITGSFADLATVGPTVTVTTGSRALVLYQCNIQHTVDFPVSAISVEVSGATTLASTFDRSAQIDGITATPTPNKLTVNGTAFVTLNPGVNTFKMTYFTTLNTASFERRMITVIPF